MRNFFTRDLVGSPIASVVVLFALLTACSADPAGLQSLNTGKDVYADVCSVCHGARGEGGVGPALSAVASTWISCGDQITWITLGSERWKAEVGDTYGATLKPVVGGMPSQDGALDTEEIAAVAAFERVEYGGATEDDALRGCGLEVTADG